MWCASTQFLEPINAGILGLFLNIVKAEWKIGAGHFYMTAVLRMVKRIVVFMKYVKLYCHVH